MYVTYTKYLEINQPIYLNIIVWLVSRALSRRQLATKELYGCSQLCTSTPYKTVRVIAYQAPAPRNCIDYVPLKCLQAPLICTHKQCNAQPVCYAKLYFAMLESTLVLARSIRSAPFPSRVSMSS